MSRRGPTLCHQISCLLVLVAVVTSAVHGQRLYEDDEIVPVRVRRQQGGGRVQVPGPGTPEAQAMSPSPPSSVNLRPPGAQASATALSSALDNAVQPPSVSVQPRPPQMEPATLPLDQPQVDNGRRPLRKKKPRVRPSKPVYDADADQDQDQDYASDRRGPPRRHPDKDDDDDDENHEDQDDEYCDHNEDNDYGHLFRPMRQMTRMMGSVFDQMQGMASGNSFRGFPGSNMAMASSQSDSDGYSRMSSLVNNNGRTRGVVSETRNGRTQTRRIGEESEDEE